jgi:hypothetical protein
LPPVRDDDAGAFACIGYATRQNAGRSTSISSMNFETTHPMAKMTRLDAAAGRIR